MGYKLEFLDRAQTQLRELDPTIAQRILKKLAWFTAQPNPLRYTSLLQGRELKEMRFRIGDYRAVGHIDQKKKIIYIADLGHRREIYR